MYEKIAGALVKAQSGFSPALKTSTNPHFKTKYADLGACIEAVIDKLNNNGIALIQKTEEKENGILIETVFLHESGEHFSAGHLFVPASQNSPQAFGSALTYARRYSLMAACGIAPEDDDGNATNFTKSRAKSEPMKVENADDPWTTKEVTGGETKHFTADGNPIVHVEKLNCEHGERFPVHGTQKDGVTPYFGQLCAAKNLDKSEQCPPIWFELSPSGQWRVKLVK